MKEPKYKILMDYGVEGLKFHWENKEYATVDEAVKDALSYQTSTPFLIVAVVDWQAVEK